MSNAPTPPGRPRRPVRPAEVVRIERLSPNFQRIVLGGPDLAAFTPGRPAAHVKIMLPRDRVTLPLVKNDDGTFGFPPPPEGAPPGPPAGLDVRTYTPRLWDAAAGELTIDFALHHDPGPAAAWATAAKVGDIAAIGGPGGGYDVPESGRLVIAGDETALPAISQIVAAAPAALSVTAIVELPSPEDAKAFGDTRHADVWFPAREGSGATGDLFAAALRELSGELTGAHVFVAGEAGLIRGLRAWLLDDEGLPRERVVTRGYWKLGASNHPDHDYGD